MSSIQLKERLVKEIIIRLKKKLEMLNRSMQDSQEEANSHIGAMESRYDTFKEEAQALRDGFAAQIQKTSEIVALMQQLVLRESTVIETGCIIETEDFFYFVSTGLLEEPIHLDEKNFECINLSAPIIQRMRLNPSIKSFEFNGRKVVFRKIF